MRDGRRRDRESRLGSSRSKPKSSHGNDERETSLHRASLILRRRATRRGERDDSSSEFRK